MIALALRGLCEHYFKFKLGYCSVMLVIVIYGQRYDRDTDDRENETRNIKESHDAKRRKRKESRKQQSIPRIISSVDRYQLCSIFSCCITNISIFVSCLFLPANRFLEQPSETIARSGALTASILLHIYETAFRGECI